jgi:hypothetical protein
MAPVFREMLDRWFAALNSGHIEEVEEMLAAFASPDIVQDWPQSGERFRGRMNILESIRNYPGFPKVDPQRVTGAEDKWVLSPHFTPLRITGTGDQYTVESKVSYPNGEEWHAVGIFHFHDGKISRVTEYFAAPFPAAEWRTQWVEKINPKS